MCKPHYRKDYYARNKARENENNRAYLARRGPEYQKQRTAEYGERRWGAERRARAEALQARLADSHKTCTRCKERLPKSGFDTDPRRVDGLYSWCKQCFRAHCRNAYDPAKDALRSAAYRQRPEAKALAQKRLRRWYADNPMRAREQSLRYQARKRNATRGTVDYDAILAQYGMECHICGHSIPSRADLHFDHVIPLSKGGLHSMENIKPSHATCNMRKSAKLIA